MPALLLGLLALLGLAAPALGQSGTRAPSSGGVVHGQNWQRGQDLNRFESTEARRRREALRRRAAGRSYPGLPSRSRGLPRDAAPAPAATPGG